MRVIKLRSGMEFNVKEDTVVEIVNGVFTFESDQGDIWSFPVDLVSYYYAGDKKNDG
jgi:hypothetical protein